MRIRRSCFAQLAGLILAFGCSSPPPVESAPTAPWSQADAVSLAGELASRVDTLYSSAYDQQLLSRDGSTNGQTLNNLRVLKQESSALRRRLENGKGRNETLHAYTRIKELSRDTRGLWRRQSMPWNLTAKADHAFNILEQLDRYYGAR